MTMRCGTFLNGNVAKHIRLRSLRVRLNLSMYGSCSSSDMMLRVMFSFKNLGSSRIGRNALSDAVVQRINPHTPYISLMVLLILIRVGMVAYFNCVAVQILTT